jgi:hypothetical protein
MPIQITRKIRILSLSLLGLVALYAALGFWLVPGLVRTQIQEFSAQHWQREPTLGEISFNPFTLTLEVHGFAFQDSTGAALMSFDRLMVNADFNSIWRRGVSLRAIELDRPAGRALVRADGSLNLDELGAPFAKAPAAADPEPARLFIDRLKLSNGVFEFEDHARATPFKARLTPVNFELLDFSTTGKSGNNYSLQAASSAGEQFRWSGSFSLAPLGSRGQFELDAVQARTLWSYLQESLGFEVGAGLVGVTGSYLFSATEPDLTLQVDLGKVQVSNLELRPRGGDHTGEPWVAVASLAIDATHIDLAKRVLTAGNIQLREGKLIAQRDAAGAINLLALLRTPAAVAEAAPEPEPASPTPSWTVNLPQVDVSGLHIAATDAFVKPAASFAIAPVNLALRGFSTSPGQPLDFSADLALESGGRLALQGKGSLAGSTFTGKLKLDGLNLAAFQPYIGSYTQMTLVSGALSTELDVDYSPRAHRIAGMVSSTQLRTIDNALREDFLKWERLTLGGVDYQSSPGSLRIASIDARSPYVRFIIAPDQTTNVGKVLTRPGDAPGPVQTVAGSGQEPTGAQKPLAMSIGKVQIHNGSANFADFWITPNYAVSLQQLAGSISGLSSQKSSRARLALQGKLDRYAPVEIAGELNLLSASLFTDIRVKFDGVELTSVTPYSGRFAGYRIEKGKLSVDVRYRVEDRQLEAEQRFIVDQLTLGERVESPDAVKLPLRLAVALLKDRNGVIDLGLPVTGSLDDPKFRVGPIIWKAFVNLLGSIATSPFKLLGGLFGGGEEVNLIDFDAGSAALDPAATEKLAALTRALRERPQLQLEVPASYSPDADLRVLASRHLEGRLAALAAAGKQPADPASLADPARRFELLLAQYRADIAGAALPASALALQAVRAKERDATALDTANRELQALLLPGIDALQAPLQALAQERARAIQDALLASGEIEHGRVFMLAAGAKPADGEKIRVALSLK